jgi:hypothetical protein
MTGTRLRSSWTQKSSDSHLNNANTMAGVVDKGEEGYGPLALYVGGAGEVRFKEIAFKDVGMKETATGAWIS